MSASTAFMNSPGLVVVSALAMDVNTSITSSCGSAKAAAAAANRTALRTIARINLNVLFGQVAGPEARTAGAPRMQDDLDQALGFIELAFQLGFREIGGETGAAHGRPLQINIDFRRIERYAGVARRGDDPAPVGIRPRDGGLDQRRIRDGSRDALGRLVAGGAQNVDGHQLARSLAVADN